MKRRLTLKFWIGCAVWIIGSFVTAMAYSRLSLGLGGGFWVDTFIILCWGTIAYTIIWGEVFTCECECHTSGGPGSDSIENESVWPGEGDRRSPGDENATDGPGVAQEQHEAEAGRTHGKAGRHALGGRSYR